MIKFAPFSFWLNYQTVVCVVFLQLVIKREVSPDLILLLDINIHQPQIVRILSILLFINMKIVSFFLFFFFEDCYSFDVVNFFFLKKNKEQEIIYFSPFLGAAFFFQIIFLLWFFTFFVHLVTRIHSLTVGVKDSLDLDKKIEIYIKRFHS